MHFKVLKDEGWKACMDVRDFCDQTKLTNYGLVTFLFAGSGIYPLQISQSLS